MVYWESNGCAETADVGWRRSAAAGSALLGNCTVCMCNALLRNAGLHFSMSGTHDAQNQEGIRPVGAVDTK